MSAKTGSCLRHQTCFSSLWQLCQFRLFSSPICEERRFAFALPCQTVILQRGVCPLPLWVFTTQTWKVSEAILLAFVLVLYWAECRQSREESDRIQSQAGSYTSCFLIYFPVVIDPLSYQLHCVCAHAPVQIQLVLPFTLLFFFFFSLLAIDARHANRMCLVEVFMLYNLSKWV